MKKRMIFITGTDTEIGKTYISIGLLRHFAKLRLKTLGLKPIASGCNSNRKNADAVQLRRAATVLLPYEYVNPFALYEPIAPHLAAKKMGLSLSVAHLNKKMALALATPCDICLLEGAGGWLLPLNEKETYADYVLSCDMEIILVVGMRLGCINHALLTCQAILQRQGKLLGWIANSGPSLMDDFDANLSTLIQLLPTPHLGTARSNPEPNILFSPGLHLLMKKYQSFDSVDAIINDLVN